MPEMVPADDPPVAAEPVGGRSALERILFGPLPGRADHHRGPGSRDATRRQSDCRGGLHDGLPRRAHAIVVPQGRHRGPGGGRLRHGVALLAPAPRPPEARGHRRPRCPHVLHDHCGDRPVVGSRHAHLAAGAPDRHRRVSGCRRRGRRVVIPGRPAAARCARRRGRDPDLRAVPARHPAIVATGDRRDARVGLASDLRLRRRRQCGAAGARRPRQRTAAGAPRRARRAGRRRRAQPLGDLGARSAARRRRRRAAPARRPRVLFLRRRVRRRLRGRAGRAARDDAQAAVGHARRRTSSTSACDARSPPG